MAWWKKREKIESVRVMYVKDRDEFPPFYWAACECDWCGERRPDEPGAREAAFADAYAHAAVHAEISPIVVEPDVAYPIDRP
ncbi:hypothetical protein [Asanoa iriomotensis]|uniref:Uncharacterized protein n=1 Tax=Asanoa iriomotensis TaxID=234613 RepID=A0ABQ4CC01_9ACTN|nr:hypothetical protein [Asanoa iriomotensis]GIF60294.1 hypothetical protein Air01nite_63890 [Asanoa iriomotensis]